MWIFHATYFKYTDFSVEYNIAEKPLTYFSSYVFLCVSAIPITHRDKVLFIYSHFQNIQNFLVWNRKKKNNLERFLFVVCGNFSNLLCKWAMIICLVCSSSMVH